MVEDTGGKAKPRIVSWGNRWVRCRAALAVIRDGGVGRTVRTRAAKWTPPSSKKPVCQLEQVDLYAGDNA